MKRLFNVSILLIGATLVLSSCNRNKKIVDENDITFVAAETNYWGDYFGNNTTVYDLFLFNNDFERSPQQNRSGIVAYFDITGPQSSNSIDIPAGTYRASTDRKAYTFYRGERTQNTDGSYSTSGSYFEIWRNNEIVDYWIVTSGNLIIERSGSYVVNGVVTTGDNTSYEFTYRGAVEKYDVTPWPETLVKGEIVFEERLNYPTFGDLNRFTIYLGGANVNLSNLTGDGDILAIELYAPIVSGDIIPNGTYNVVYDPQEAPAIVDGYEFFGTDNLWHDAGTWYYTSKKFAIADGDMIVTVNGNNYNLDYEFYTQSGMKIAGVFNSNMQILSAAPASVKSKSIQRVSPEKNRNAVKRSANSPATRVLSNSRIDNQRKIVR
ncbi:MAG: hypothetical protein ACK5KP_00150 [Paludibacteraceae bacterium]